MPTPSQTRESENKQPQSTRPTRSRLGVPVRQATPDEIVQRVQAGAPTALRPGDILTLQRAYGNRVVQRLLAERKQGGAATSPTPVYPVQAKLTVGPAGDSYEREADRVAQQVVGAVAVPGQVKQHNTVQRTADGGVGPLVGAAAEAAIQRLRGGGQPLEPHVRAKMEYGFQADFSEVKVHTDAEADKLNRSLQSRAFTTGQDLFFKRGAYDPRNLGGQALLAHELTHVVQQNGPRQYPPAQPAGIARAPDVRQPGLTVTPLSSGTQAAMVQRLSEEERLDKVRIITDYVRFTPPGEVGFPNNKQKYLEALLKKISSNAYIMESLKSKKNMQSDAEDDDWQDRDNLNIKTLNAAIDRVYSNQLQPIDGEQRIGKVFQPFNQHDCVFAAINYALGLPDGSESKVADYFHHEKGEVEDSILYRMMEKLGWPFLGKGTWDELFPSEVALRPGKFIVSENKDSGGTQGHVLMVDGEDAVDIEGGVKVNWKIRDRQFERKYRGDRQNAPQFDVYVWRVRATAESNALLEYIQGEER